MIRDWVPPVLWRWVAREQKASRVTRGQVIVTGTQDAVWTPRDYAALSREGYEINATVYACVNEYARSIGALHWLLFQRGPVREVELDEHPLLRLLRRPNPWERQGFFFQKVIGYLMLSGNTYIERVGPGPDGLGPPRELFALRPDRMTVLPDPQRGLRGYRWHASGQQQDFPAEAILHLKLFHPTHDWYGLSPISAAARAIDTDNAAAQHNFNLLRHGLRPSGALVVQSPLSEAEFRRLRLELEQQYGGAERAGLPMLLEGGLDWKEMGLSPKDADYVESRRLSKQDIATAYHVPPELIGLKTATFENRREARKAFYTEAVLPMADALRDELNHWLAPLFGEGLRLDYDRDAIEALQEDREKLWARVTAANFLTLNEKRLAVGYDEVPGGDVILINATEIPLDEAGATGPDFATVDQQAGAASAVDRKAAAGLEPRAREWTARVLQFAPIERRVLLAVRRWLAAQRDGVLRRLAASSAFTAAVPRLERKDVEELLFVVEEETESLRRVTRPLFEEALKRGGQAVWIELHAEGEFGHDGAGAQMRLLDLLAKVKSIVEHLKARVRQVIEAALNEAGGAPGLAEIAARIREAYRELSVGRAQTIARTETAKAYNAGRDEAMAQLGVETIEWLTARDERVRATHAAQDGEVRRRGEPFPNGLRYPNDPLGPPEEVINCRCVAIPAVR